MTYVLLAYVVCAVLNLYVSDKALKTMNLNIFGKYRIRSEDRDFVRFWVIMSLVPGFNMVNLAAAYHSLLKSRREIRTKNR